VTLAIRAGIFCAARPQCRRQNDDAENSHRIDEADRRRRAVCGFDVQAEPIEVRRRLAYVPDFPFLTTNSRPGNFSALPGNCSECRRSNRNEREGIDRAFPSGRLCESPARSLSHGTRQRVAIVSALLHNPEVFVVDERWSVLIRNTPAL